MRYLFEDYAFDTHRRELHRGADVVSLAPQVFDLLDHLIRNRERVVSKDELINAVWNGRSVSDAALATRLNVARGAIGDTGEEQRLIKTLPRKGFRFVGPVREALQHAAPVDNQIEAPNPALALPDRPSIAILPFTNMSSDPEQDYFADGIADDITTALSRFKSLFVIARNSSFTYKGKAVDIKQVGRELGVRYVLEGSVRKAAGRVRISGQLIDATTGAHLWADTFNGALDDIFGLQDSITSTVVGAIVPRLQQSEFEWIKRKPTDNMSAYDHYLRGLSRMYQFEREQLEEARRLFRKAIELDPEFAAPYAALAFRYGIQQVFGWGWLTSEEQSELVALADRAVELDGDDATVLVHAGSVLALMGHQVERGAALIEQAITANPNLGIAWSYRGMANVLLGNHEVAIEYSKHGMRLSPLDPLAFVPKINLAWACLFSDKYNEASKWAMEAVIAKPGFLGPHRCASVCYALAGNIEGAKTSWEIAKRMNPTQRISHTRQFMPLRREADHAKLVEGFRLVGMPE